MSHTPSLTMSQRAATDIGREDDSEEAPGAVGQMTGTSPRIPRRRRGDGGCRSGLADR
jgi:hypothetical protein